MCPLVAVLVISRVVVTDGLIFRPKLYTEREKMRNDLDSRGSRCFAGDKVGKGGTRY